MVSVPSRRSKYGAVNEHVAADGGGIVETKRQGRKALLADLHQGDVPPAIPPQDLAGNLPSAVTDDANVPRIPHDMGVGEKVPVRADEEAAPVAAARADRDDAEPDRAGSKRLRSGAPRPRMTSSG